VQSREVRALNASIRSFSGSRKKDTDPFSPDPFSPEDVNYACGAVFLYVIDDAFGKQGGLIAVLALNEAAHGAILCGKATFYRAKEFSRSLGR
jgi:hypothetical protein